MFVVPCEPIFQYFAFLVKRKINKLRKHYGPTRFPYGNPWTLGTCLSWLLFIGSVFANGVFSFVHVLHPSYIVSPH